MLERLSSGPVVVEETSATLKQAPSCLSHTAILATLWHFCQASARKGEAFQHLMPPQLSQLMYPSGKRPELPNLSSPSTSPIREVTEEESREKDLNLPLGPQVIGPNLLFLIKGTWVPPDASFLQVLEKRQNSKPRVCNKKK